MCDASWAVVQEIVLLYLRGNCNYQVPRGHFCLQSILILKFYFYWKRSMKHCFVFYKRAALKV